MQIGSLSGASSMWDLAAIHRDEETRYSSIASQTTPSGDRVEISDEGRELYSRMIHKYDNHASKSGAGEETSQSAGQGGGGAGGGGSSESTNDIEKIRQQIQALKSQIMSLASQAQAQGPGSAAMSQMSALEAQVAALESQLNEMAA